MSRSTVGAIALVILLATVLAGGAGMGVRTLNSALRAGVAVERAAMLTDWALAECDGERCGGRSVRGRDRHRANALRRGRGDRTREDNTPRRDSGDVHSRNAVARRDAHL